MANIIEFEPLQKMKNDCDLLKLRIKVLEGGLEILKQMALRNGLIGYLDLIEMVLEGKELE